MVPSQQLGNRQRLPGRQKGTVLITVILMVALAALIATDIGYRQKLDIKRTSAFLSRDQAFHYLLSAENLAKFALVADLKQDNSKNDPLIVDSVLESWTEANDKPFPVAGGMIQGNLTDLQSKFNVNSIMDSDQQIQETQRRRLRLLMDSLGVPDPKNTSLSSNMLIERLVDWMDSDPDPTGLDGKEDLDYLSPNLPSRPDAYRAANQLIFDPSELLQIEGFTSNDVKKLQDYVSFLPVEAPINLNTVNLDLLPRIMPEISTSVLELERNAATKTTKEGAYETLAELFQKALTATASPLGSDPEDDSDNEENTITAPNGATAQQPIGNFSVNSEYFLLEAKAIINGKPVLMESIIYRPTIEPGSNNKDIKIKTLSRKLVDPLKRV